MTLNEGSVALSHGASIARLVLSASESAPPRRTKIFEPALSFFSSFPLALARNGTAYFYRHHEIRPSFWRCVYSCYRAVNSVLTLVGVISGVGKGIIGMHVPAPRMVGS